MVAKEMNSKMAFKQASTAHLCPITYNYITLSQIKYTEIYGFSKTEKWTQNGIQNRLSKWFFLIPGVINTPANTN